MVCLKISIYNLSSSQVMQFIYVKLSQVMQFIYVKLRYYIYQLLHNIFLYFDAHNYDKIIDTIILCNRRDLCKCWIILAYVRHEICPIYFVIVLSCLQLSYTTPPHPHTPIYILYIFFAFKLNFHNITNIYM